MKKYLSALAVIITLGMQNPATSQSLDNSRIGAGDKPEAILTMPRAARVSISATSALGAAFSLHDRLEGQIYRAGSSGQSDGRIDASLDPGQYKLRLENPEAAGGPVQLRVRTFTERNGDRAGAWPRLIGGQVLEASLQDLESSSYWLELREDGPLEVEVLGRNLALLEVWREGQYIVGSWKPREEVQVVAGKPMGWIAASKVLKAGSYLVKVYGAQARAWAKEDGSHPLYVRSGFMRMPVGGRIDLKLSPFGRDFILVDNLRGASLSRNDKVDTRLSGGSYTPGGDRLATNDSDGISPKSQAPWCMIDLPRGLSLITVKGAPGDLLRLDAWASQGSVSFDAPKAGAGGLLTILAPRTGDANLEPTGLVYRWLSTSQGRRAEILRDFCPPLSGKDFLRRRVNLLQSTTLTMYLRVDEAGNYRIAEKTGLGQAKAIYTISPLDSSLAPGRQSYEASPDRGTVSLTKGYHLLRIQAKDLGILDFVILRDGIGQTGRGELAAEPLPARTSLAWALTATEAANGLSLLTGQRGSSPTGSDFRAFPLAIPGGVFLELGPREELRLPLGIPSPVKVTSLSPLYSLSADGAGLALGSSLRSGPKTLALLNPGQTAVEARLGLTEDQSDIPEDRVTDFASGLAVLSPGQTLWRDFQRNESLFAAFEVKAGAVYALESQARLSTSLVLRSATRERIRDARANGYGRNAAIRTYLGPGQYYLELKTEGRSAGRAGLSLKAVPQTARLDLAPGVVDGRRVAADSMLRYDFLLAAPARLRLSSIGIGSSYAIRIEDGDGFPLYNGSAEASLALGAGSYALFSLPLSIETRRVSSMTLVPEAAGVLQGPGLRRLEFNRRVQALWLEGPEADHYAFTAPADLGARLELPKGFVASLEGPGGKQELVAGANELGLKAGDYSLSLRPKENASQLAYSVFLSTSVLAPGINQSLGLDTGRSGELKVSLPREGFYELWSQGQNDLAAELLGPDGQSLAASDDNGADWNINIAQRLPAGSYRLRLRSLAGGGKTSEFRLEERKPRSGARLTTSLSLGLDRDGAMLSLDPGMAEGLYVIEASNAGADLRLYRGKDLLARSEGRIAIPLRKGGDVSLYATSPSPLQASLSLRRVAEKKPGSLSDNIVLEAGESLKVLNAEVLSARIVEGRILVSPGLDSPCEDPGRDAFSVRPEGGWLWAPEARSACDSLVLETGASGSLGLDGLDQGFSLATPKEELVLIKADTRGGFRAGSSALAASSPGAPPRDWWASQAWSGGSLSLLPPGSWKARIWDGEAGPGIHRKLGYVLESYKLDSRTGLGAGAKTSLSLGPGRALALDLPAGRAEILLGEDLVVAAWRDGKALGGCNSLDGRLTKNLDLPASTLYVANTGRAESSFRIRLLPSPAPSLVDKDRPFEARSIGPEGMELQVQAQAGDLLCLAGTAETMDFLGNDGSFRRIEARTGLWQALPASPGRLILGQSPGLLRVWLAKPGQELQGLTEDSGPAGSLSSLPELKDLAALPSGRAGAFRLSLAAPGFVNLSAPGPGVLAISGKGIETRASLSRDGEDIQVFAWLPAGDYRVWERPARDSPGVGWLRATRIEAGKIAAAEDSPGGLIGAGEFQAWAFKVQDAGLVGLGVKADKDGLGLLLYDAKQGLLASGTLILEDLEAGDYLAVVKGLEDETSEYRLVVEGAFGSRNGVPQNVIDGYRKAGGRPSPAIGVPLHGRGTRLIMAQDEPSPSQDEEEYLDEYEDGGDEGDYPIEDGE